MNNKDFIHTLSQQLKQDSKETQLNIYAFVSAFTKLLECEGKAQLSGCGLFTVVQEKERIELDETTGQRTIFPPKLLLHFDASDTAESDILNKYLVNELRTTPSEAKVFIEQCLSVLKQGMQQDHMVKIKGFGTFKEIATPEKPAEQAAQWVFEPEESLETTINKPFEDFPFEILHEDVPPEEFKRLDQQFSENSAPEVAEPDEQTPQSDPQQPEEQPSSDASPAEHQEQQEADDSNENSAPTSPQEPTSSLLDHVDSITQAQLDAYIDERITLISTQIIEQERQSWATQIKELEDKIQQMSNQQQDQYSDFKEEVVAEINESQPQRIIEDPVEEYFEETPRRHRKWLNVIIILFFITILLVFGIYYGPRYLKNPQLLFNQRTEQPAPLPIETPDSLVQADSIAQTLQPQEEAEQSKESKSKKDSLKNVQPPAKTAPAVPKNYSSSIAYKISGTASVHTIKPGQGIFYLARKYYGNKEMAKYIIQYNELNNPDDVKVGQKIKIPLLVH